MVATEMKVPVSVMAAYPIDIPETTAANKVCLPLTNIFLNS